MDEKLKKIALKLSKKYDYGTVEDVYKKFMRDVGNQKDYFSMYTPENLIKITFYIFSLMRTKGFELGDSMIKNCFVGNFFEFGKDDFAQDTCEQCNGNGQVECESCGGSGEYSCSKCNGDGEIECDTCEGDGEDSDGDACETCRGSGEIDCDDCEGSGSETCDECRGNGNETCGECDGNGEVESDKLIYYNQTFLVWDKKLINILRTHEELNKPLPDEMSDSIIEFVNENKMCFLDEIRDEAEFKTEVQPDVKYCFFLEGLDGEIVLTNNNRINTQETPDKYIY